MKRIHTHILILILITIGAIGSVYALARFVLYLRTTQAVVIAADERIASYEQNKKIFADEFVAVGELGNRIKKLEGYTITPATTPNLLSSLEDLARAHHIDFRITSVQNPGKQKTERLTMDFSASGDSAALTAFVDDLSHQTYLMKFNKFSLVSDGTPTGTWNVVASIQIMSFGI